MKQLKYFQFILVNKATEKSLSNEIPLVMAFII